MTPIGSDPGEEARQKLVVNAIRVASDFGQPVPHVSHFHLVWNIRGDTGAGSNDFFDSRPTLMIGMQM